jgi:thioredoxin-dependent peroxiredoxin
VLGVSFDSIEENLAFHEKFGFNFPLLCDTERQMGVAYGAASDNQSSHAARIGVVVGPNSKIISWMGKVDAKKFPQQVLDIIRQDKS